MKSILSILSLYLLVVLHHVQGQDPTVAVIPEVPPSGETSSAVSDQAVPDEAGDTESPATGEAESYKVAEQMTLFGGHVGTWKGLTKTSITEKGKESITNTRYQWSGGYLLGGHVFEIRGHSYGGLGRTEYRWQYTFDSLKERFMASYYDSHGHTYFFEGKVNQEQTKIIWRLLAAPGDMAWHVETDLQTENGIETNGRITSQDFEYNMVYTSVFKQL